MSGLVKTLWHMLGWMLRGLVLIFCLVAGVSVWAVGTQPGTQWLLEKIVTPVNGHVTGVGGSLWRGLHIGRLTLPLPEVSLEMHDLGMQIVWKDLLQRRLHVRMLSVASLKGVLTQNNVSTSSTQGAVILPLAIFLEKVTIANITLTRRGQLLPFSGKNLHAMASADASGAQLHIETVQIVNPHGQGAASAEVNLQHLAAPWPLVAKLRVALQDKDVPDRAAASASFTLTRTAHATQQLEGRLVTNQLNVAQFAGKKFPATALTMHTGVEFDITDEGAVRQLQIDGEIDPTSRWNNQRLGGSVQARASLKSPAGQKNAQAAQQGGSQQAMNGWALFEQLHVDLLQANVQVGRNQLLVQGSLGSSTSAITLQVEAPTLSALRADWAGSLTLNGKFAGMSAHHQVTLRTRYLPAHVRSSRSTQTQKQGLDFAASVTGAWGKGVPEADQVGWRGTLSQFQFAYAGLQIKTLQPMGAFFLPDAAAPLWQWQLDAIPIRLRLPDGTPVQVRHAGTRWGAGRWETAGKVDALALTPTTLQGIQQWVNRALGRPTAYFSDRMTTIFPKTGALTLGIAWDLHQTGVLAGHLSVVRQKGDLHLPREIATPLGLRTLRASLTATPVSSHESQLAADFNVVTAKMGKMHVVGTTRLRAHSDGKVTLADPSLMRASLDADIQNLQWVELFMAPGTDLGGFLQAHVQAQRTPDGSWRAQGTVRGKSLQVVRIDDGVRLVGGTLEARLQEDKLIIDSLYFPATFRRIPHDAHVRPWMSPAAQPGGSFIQASGKWRLADGVGKVQIALHHFPIVQRMDRYIIASGQITLETTLSTLNILGVVRADAGWINIDASGGVPSLDDDVMVHRLGKPAVTTAPALRIMLNIKADLGSHFHLNGKWVDTGLGGAVQIRYEDRLLTGTGVLHTQEGYIDTWGQHLQLQHGVITFQGKLDNPLLDIEALRKGEAVEAGLHVGGTAKQLLITLVSYPEVSEEEKISWLVLGRAPETGSDISLLMTVASIMLGEEPFYKQLGIDDIRVHSGAVGSSASLLPVQTVASGDRNQDLDSALASQILVASKHFANSLTLSIEQALSGAQTVGRLSYALSRSWSVDLKGGDVNGLALIYRAFIGE